MPNDEKALTPDQKRVMEIIRDGENVFVSGFDGEEKPFLINEILSENREKNFILCACGKKAAAHFGGETLKEMFGIPTGLIKVGDYNSNVSSVLKNADIIIIDEIDSCRIDAFEYVMRTLMNIKKQKFAEKNYDHYDQQIILLGDFYKEPPTVTKAERRKLISEWGLMRREDLFAFNSSLWEELEIVNVTLKEAALNSSRKAYFNQVTKKKKDSSFYKKTYRNPEEELPRPFRSVCNFYDGVHQIIGKVNAKTYTSWDRDEDLQIKDEWARGYSLADIALAHKRSIGAVRARLIRI